MPEALLLIISCYFPRVLLHSARNCSCEMKRIESKRDWCEKREKASHIHCRVRQWLGKGVAKVWGSSAPLPPLCVHTAFLLNNKQQQIYLTDFFLLWWKKRRREIDDNKSTHSNPSLSLSWSPGPATKTDAIPDLPLSLATNCFQAKQERRSRRKKEIPSITASQMALSFDGCLGLEHVVLA